MKRTNIEIDDKATRPEPAEQSGGDEEGPTMLEKAQGLFSRYFEYFNAEHQDTLHLSTPFFSKDDVAAVFEQLMAASIEGTPLNNWDKKSKVRFNTWESTILI